MPPTPPTLYVIAGPNGVGKTTFARVFLPDYVHCTRFVNADLIAGGLSPFSPETAALRAGKLLITEMQSYLRQRADFGFETTLAGVTYAALFRKLRAQGYAIHLFFLWIPTVNLALARVADRVRRGGHNVPEPVVRRRFHRGLRHFFQVYQPLVNAWMLFDNSGSTPVLVAKGGAGMEPIVAHAITYETIRQQARG